MNSTAPDDEVHSAKCELAAEVLRASGRLRLQVTGWSMLPSVRPGDTLIVDRIAPDEVVKGDIVLFGRDRRLFAHRVIERSGSAQFITHGDSMGAPDAPVATEELLGKVSFVVRDGKCIEPRKTPLFTERAVAALVRRSDTAARIVMGVHGLRHRTQIPAEQD